MMATVLLTCPYDTNMITLCTIYIHGYALSYLCKIPVKHSIMGTSHIEAIYR